VTYYLMLKAAAVCRFVPLRVAYWGSIVLAELVWFVKRDRRRAAIANMTHVLGDHAAAVAAARRSFHNYGRYLVDFVRAPKIRREAMLEKV